ADKKSPYVRELQLLQGNQTKIFQVHGCLLHNNHDQTNTTAPNMMLVMQDISEQRRVEQIRKDFVTNASHEFKTPLTVVRGYVETLLDSKPIAEPLRQRFLSQIVA